MFFPYMLVCRLFPRSIARVQLWSNDELDLHDGIFNGVPEGGSLYVRKGTDISSGPVRRGICSSEYF